VTRGAIEPTLSGDIARPHWPQPQSRGTPRNANPNMSLLRLHLIFFPSVLALALPGWAEARQANAKSPAVRPLNLSLPRDVLPAPGSGRIDETVQRNLIAPPPAPADAQAPTHLPYGAGYERRWQEPVGAPPGAGAGGGAGAGIGSPGGSGRRGR